MRRDPMGLPSITRKFLMNPSSLRILQISSLSLETGTSSRSCLARRALRIWVSRSAMGSVMLIVSLLESAGASPARLDHAGQIALQRQVAEVDAAETELAVVAAGAAADAAAVAIPHVELQLLRFLGDLRSRSHRRLLTLERNAELAQQELCALIVARGRHDRDVHPLGFLDLVVIDLREDQVVPDPQGVIAAAVEALRRRTAEVAHARQRDGDQPVQELPHADAAQGHAAADRHALPHLEGGDGFLGPGDRRLLPGEGGHLLDGVVEDLDVLDRVTHPHVEGDLLDPGHRHDVVDAELLAQARDDLVLVALLEPRDVVVGRRPRLHTRGGGLRLVLAGLGVLAALSGRIFLVLRHVRSTSFRSAERPAAALADAHAAAVFQALAPEPGGLAALRADHLQIRHLYRP